MAGTPDSRTPGQGMPSEPEFSIALGDLTGPSRFVTSDFLGEVSERYDGSSGEYLGVYKAEGWIIHNDGGDSLNDQPDGSGGKTLNVGDLLGGSFVNDGEKVKIEITVRAREIE